MQLVIMSRQTDILQQQMSMAYKNRKQFEQLLTGRGHELLQQYLWGKAGVYSERVCPFASQLHFCLSKVYSQLRCCFRFDCSPFPPFVFVQHLTVALG